MKRPLLLLLVAPIFVCLAFPSWAAAPPYGWVNIKGGPTATCPSLIGATGNGTTDDTAAIQAAIDCAFSVGATGVYCPVGSYKISSTIYLDPPGNLRSNLTNPTNFNFSMSFYGDQTGGGNPIPGCRLNATFNNNIAFLMGSGSGMEVNSIAIAGPVGTYRGLQSSSGVGIGTAGGNGGSSKNLIENTYVSNFYALYKTDANGGCCLADQNTFRKVGGNNGYVCLEFSGAQVYINDVFEPEFYCTIGVQSVHGNQVSIYGGYIYTNGLSTSFSISGTTGLAGTYPGPYTFSTTIASPDANVGTVYNSYMLLTTHFGLQPLYLTNWNSSTDVATFQIWDYSYTSLDLSSGGGSDLTTELQAATTIYTAERTSIAQGMGIHLYDTHTEGNACVTLLDYSTGQTSNPGMSAQNHNFGYDIGLAAFATGTAAQRAHFYCQQVFPFIEASPASSGDKLVLEGGNFGGLQTSMAPVLIESEPLGMVSGEKLGNLGAGFNYRLFDTKEYQINPNFRFETVGRGLGTWDADYTQPAALLNNDAWTMLNFGELRVPYCGYEPCPWSTPSLSPAVYALVSGSLGALGTYPPIACRTVFKSTDWNSGALAHIFLRSASCPGYSWGQNLTDALVGETVTWTYKGQSDALYLDAKTLSWMFPGLGITITDTNGTNTYLVTAVHPQLGYITVMSTASNIGTPLAGTKTVVYTCASSCTIGQHSFAWTAY